MKTLNVLLPLVLATALVGCGGSDSKPKPPKLNSAPVATAASFTTQTDTGINGTLMGSDADGDALTFSIYTEPTQGTVMIAADGSFMYLPNETVTGMDQFAFRVSDGKKSSLGATVNIDIEPLQLSFNDYSRAAFDQAPNDIPLPTNGREFEQDVTNPNAYDDLLQ